MSTKALPRHAPWTPDRQHAGGYFEMTPLPQALRPAEPPARAAYRSGWRPAHAAAADLLVEIIRAAGRMRQSCRNQAGQ